jgi:hypothetical protein
MKESSKQLATRTDYSYQLYRVSTLLSITLGLWVLMGSPTLTAYTYMLSSAGFLEISFLKCHVEDSKMSLPSAMTARGSFYKYSVPIKSSDLSLSVLWTYQSKLSAPCLLDWKKYGT